MINSKLHKYTRNKPLRIDLDYPSEYKLLRVYFNLKAISNKVIIIKSKHGYHLIAKDVKGDMESRFEFEDCPGRLYHSDLRGGDDVMFDAKGTLNKYGVKLHINEEVDESNLLSLPYVSKIPRAYYVLKKNKKYGKRRRVR